MEVLKAQDLKKVYETKAGKVEALKGVSLTLKEGEVLAFLGPNGAGKTTTIKMLTGLVKPDHGTVSIDGKYPYKDPIVLRHIGTVLEGNRNLYWRLTPEENLEYFGVLKGLSRREALVEGGKLLDRFGLQEKKGIQVQSLSRGMQQKLAIAVSIVHKPKLLLLDEPTLGLDVQSAEEIKQIIRELKSEGHSVLLTTHQLEVAQEISDRVSIIRGGKIIVEESTEELIRQFSGGAYVISMGSIPGEDKKREIVEFGAIVEGNQVIVRGGNEGLYGLLNILSPIPLEKIEKDEATLTDIFLKLVREDVHVETVSG